MLSIWHSCPFAAILLLVMVGRTVAGEQIDSRLRLVQASPLESLAYSSYTSVQIFHLLNWQQNDKLIRNINGDQSRTFVAAHNQFSFLSIREIQQLYLTLNITQFAHLHVASPQTNTLPLLATAAVHTSPQRVGESIDWRSKRSGPVRNQGKCGACWAFSATADLQSYYMSTYGFPIDFSEQQLIDCSQSYGNMGCSGGMMNNAYLYVIDFGITLQSYYPYTQTVSKCSYDGKSMPHFNIKQSKVIESDCSALTVILKERPVSVVISANPSFIFYRSGILNECGSVINHSMQLVGLVSDSSGSYYIGKNSWGSGWGDQGYIYIDSLLQQGNLCNICAFPQYPI